MPQLFIFRHGETDWNKEGKIQGHLDIPLNNTGQEQAESLAPFISKLNLDIIISSDLKRALKTAEIATQDTNLKIEIYDALREGHLGAAQGKSREDTACDHLFKIWRENRDPNFAFEGGESRNELKRRVTLFIQEYVKNNPHERIGISTHGGSMMRILEHCSNTPSDFKCHNCALIEVSINDNEWNFIQKIN